MWTWNQWIEAKHRMCSFQVKIWVPENFALSVVNQTSAFEAKKANIDIEACFRKEGTRVHI